MSRRHAARPWLVVDNSSSSDSSTPCSRAKRIKGKCSRDGMPRSGQLRTVDSESPSKTPISSKPPNRIIKSVVVAMRNKISHIGTNCNPEVGCFGDLARCSNLMLFRRDCGKMGNMPRQRTKEDVEFGKRLKAARIALTDQKAAPFARSMELNPQTYRNYERGDRRPGRKALEAFDDKGISLYWLFLARHPILIVDQKQKIA